MPAEDFDRYSNILIDATEYLGGHEPVVKFLNVDKGITTLAIKINLNFCRKGIKNRTI